MQTSAGGSQELNGLPKRKVMEFAHHHFLSFNALYYIPFMNVIRLSAGHFITPQM